MITALIFFVLVSINPLNAWSLFGTKPLTPEEKIQQLQKQQVDCPDDPVVNYNLGVALYRAHKFDQAKANFERTLAHTNGLQLQTQTLFNTANASLKQALATLPPTWEQEETIEPQLLDNAISLVTAAIENYQKFLTHQPEHTAGSTNKTYAEEIKKKLEEKKKQQQQQNKQDKKDKQNNNQEQSQENQQDQQKDQKNNQQEQQQKNQDEHKQDQRNEQNDQKQQQSEQQKQEQQAQQRQLQNAQQEQQQAESEPAQAAQAQQSQESSEERRMRALLENLQSDETERQKALVRQNAMNQQPPQQGQKPW